jgi:hypothetical protein
VSLAEKEKALAAKLGPSERAKRLAPKLLEEAAECRLEARFMPNVELLELRAALLEEAADLLRILETEQFRQRTAAATHLHGRMDRAELRQITQSWNESK